MEFRRILSVNDPLFNKAFALYETSFPEYEKRFPGTQALLIQNPLYHFDVIMDGGEFSGIVLYWKGAFYTYIEHFAILESMRGKAVGSRSLGEFCGNHTFVVLEIDPPVDEVSIRRESFYNKIGFARNGYAHLHPAYRKQFPPHELVVMSYPGCMTEEEYQIFRLELDGIVMKDSPV